MRSSDSFLLYFSICVIILLGLKLFGVVDISWLLFAGIACFPIAIVSLLAIICVLLFAMAIIYGVIRTIFF